MLIQGESPVFWNAQTLPRPAGIWTGAWSGSPLPSGYGTPRFLPASAESMRTASPSVSVMKPLRVE